MATFTSGYFAANPTEGVWAGLHEFDGKLPDWSPDGLGAEVRRLEEAAQRARAFDSAALDERRGFEREVLLAEIDRQLFWRRTADKPHKNPTFYSDALDPNAYVVREYAPLEERLRAYTRFARGIPKAAEQIRANLASPLPRAFAALARKNWAGLAEYFEGDVMAVFGATGGPELQAELREANGLAARAMRDLAAWVAGREEVATPGYALGPELFRAMLWATQRIDLPIEALVEIGQRDRDRNLGALKDACRAYAPEATIPDCVAALKKQKPTDALSVARRQLDELKRFLQEKDLVSVPSSADVAVAEAPPYKRWNYAFIEIPGPFEGALSPTYYLTPPDPSWPPEERAAYGDAEPALLFTSVHEVWPGHFLAFLHQKQSPSKLAAIFGGSAFAEGWAHYAEELMWEAGLRQGDPSARIGQLLAALLRNVRFLVAIGLHTGGMSLEEAERMFREAALLDAANARQQAARGTFDPEYLNYTLNKLIIRKLRDEWCAPRGGRAAWRQFHDQLLAHAGPPVAVIRAWMLGPGRPL